MTIFRNVNSGKLDSFIGLIQGNRASYQPVLTDKENAILNSNDVTLKTTVCAKLLISWQNRLNRCKIDPGSTILFNADKFSEFTGSQKALNKLKRKFGRLVIGGMPKEEQGKLAQQAAAKFHLQQPGVLFINHMLKYHGDDAICLELIGEQIHHPLNSVARAPEKLVTLLGDSKNPQPHPRLVLAVASAAEHFPLATNTWGYPGQEASPLARVTPTKMAAIEARRAELRKKVAPQIYYWPTPWNKVLEISEFEFAIKAAKLINGSPIGNCGERTNRIFYQLTRQRKFDDLMKEEINPGDHAFVNSKDPAHLQRYVLDAWNGAKVYPEEKVTDHLYDYCGVSGKGLARLKKFNSTTQKVSPLAYSTYPLDAFKKDSKTKHLYLIELLKEFHQIPRLQRQEKMIKALEIIQFIEMRMPLYEFVDPAVHELYDQMVFLTKKERKKGLKLPSQNDKGHCLINEALHNLDLPSLQKQLSENGKMNGLTILHAIKASLRANDLRFLQEVVDAKVPIERNSLTNFYNTDPHTAIMALVAALYAEDSSVDLSPSCAQAVQNNKKGGK